MSQEAKRDAGKPRLSLVPTQIMFDVAEVREYGITKYTDPDNWKQVELERYYNAALRHLLAYGQDPHGVDDESGIEHYKHLACNVAFICALEADKDKRVKRVDRDLVRNVADKLIDVFTTYADVCTVDTQYRAYLQPINVGDKIYIKSDENHGYQPAEYRVASKDGSGNLTYTFVRIVPDIARNFLLDPIACDRCDGRGEVDGMDAAGSRDHHMRCPKCHGEGVARE